MRKNLKIFLFIFFVLMCNIGVVNATTKTATVTRKGGTSDRIYYGGDYTYYNKKLDGYTAYCITLKRRAPSVGKKYTNVVESRYKYTALVEGQIIKIGKAKYGTGKKGYQYIQEALNCFTKYRNYYSGACGTSRVKTLINSAKKEVNKYDYKSGKSTSSLPALSYSVSNKNLTNKKPGEYVSEKVDLEGLVKTFGSSDYETQAPSYELTATAETGTAYICPNNSYSDECKTKVTITNRNEAYSFYVYLKNGGNNGGKVKIATTGSNASKYPSGALWKNSNSNLQWLVTSANIKITRSISKKLTFSYAESDKYVASLAKVDENGEDLPGAILSLYTARDENGQNKVAELCKFNEGDTSCSNDNLKEAEKGYSNGNYLCYKEESAPAGYKSISTKCSAINLGQKTTKYWEGDREITKEEYDKYNGAASYCIVNPTEDNFSDDYINRVINQELNENPNLSIGSCEAVNTNPADVDPSAEPTGDPQTDPAATVYKKSICIAGDGTYDSTGTYCQEHAELAKFDNLNGDYNITVVNSLNSISISKKAITGDAELPGASLAIYTTDSSGKCTSTLAKARKFEFQDYKSVINEETDNEGNEEESDGEDDEQSGNDNEESDNKEDVGEDNNEWKDNENTEEDTIEDITEGLKWTSTNSEAIISGLDAGTYCLVEEIAPEGYKKLTSTTKFSMNEAGETTLIDAEKDKAELVENKEGNTQKMIILHNDINKMSISKTDMATSKELPGAKITICSAGKNDEGKYEMATTNSGECSVATLVNGEEATWTSTNEPHKLEGLTPGAYYLVEEIAPDGYSTAESILFILNEDGTLTDENGKSLADSKLVMKDKPIDEPKTGMIALYITLLIGAGVAFIWYKASKNMKVKNSV